MKTFGALMNTLCRGTVGYFSYLATTGTNTIYSEYMLYEPILRILQAKRYSAHCEYTIQKTLGRGDNKKIDFKVVDHVGDKFAIEVKWAKKKKINISNDIEKLQLFHQQFNAPGYLLVFGHLEDIQELKFSKSHKAISKGSIVAWKSGRTQYAARWIRVS